MRRSAWFLDRPGRACGCRGSGVHKAAPPPPSPDWLSIRAVPSCPVRTSRATHVATNTISQTVSNAEGLFTLPGLQIGVYTVNVTLQGFQELPRDRRRAHVGRRRQRPRDTGDPAALSEQVLVMSTSEVVQTQSSTVSTTINTNQITKLPLTTRSADGLREPAAWRVDAGRQSRCDDQRPAAGDDQHHARRRQRPGQHARARQTASSRS